MGKIPVVHFYLTDPLLLMNSTSFSGLISNVYKCYVDLVYIGFPPPLNHVSTIESSISTLKPYSLGSTHKS